MPPLASTYMQQVLLNKLSAFFEADLTRFVASFALLISSIIFRRKEMWSIALVVGSSAYAAKQLFWLFIRLIGSYKMTHVDSQLAHFFVPTSTPAEWVFIFRNTLLFLSILFPVGLILGFVRYIQIKHSRKNERGTRRRNSEATGK